MGHQDIGKDRRRIVKSRKRTGVSTDCRSYRRRSSLNLTAGETVALDTSDDAGKIRVTHISGISLHLAGASLCIYTDLIHERSAAVRVVVFPEVIVVQIVVQATSTRVCSHHEVRILMPCIPVFFATLLAVLDSSAEAGDVTGITGAGCCKVSSRLGIEAVLPEIILKRSQLVHVVIIHCTSSAVFRVF